MAASSRKKDWLQYCSNNGSVSDRSMTAALPNEHACWAEKKPRLVFFYDVHNFTGLLLRINKKYTSGGARRLADSSLICKNPFEAPARL